MEFKITRFEVVDSTNRLAAESGRPGDVFVAAEQTAGRGRLDHKWHSRAGENLLMSAVFDVGDVPVAEAATFPLAVGLAVREVTGGEIKWPNDVYLNGRKVCGILCERHGGRVVAGIGVNVNQREFPEELADRATSLAREGVATSVDAVLEKLLAALAALYTEWRERGFAALAPRFAEVDFLKGREVSVIRTDDDREPARGICGGIADDGSLLVGGERIYAGEVRWR